MVRRLDENRKSARATTLTTNFTHGIIGQPEATEALVYLIDKWQAGFYDRTRPIGSMMFLGPTGTGKTETVEVFAESIYGNPDFLLKVDCAEFQHSHEIAKLIGSPPGYLGHRETHPFFTNERMNVRRTTSYPFNVILFDEIEKASDALWNLLLGILDKGRLTTGTNDAVDFTQSVIIMTSNVGSKEMTDDDIGFTREMIIPSGRLGDLAVSAAKRKFMPEFLNRLDKLVVFNTLTPKDIEQVLDIQLTRLHSRVSATAKPFDFEVTDSALAQLLKEGYDRKYNARNIKRVIDQRLGIPFSKLAATGQLLPGEIIRVDYVNEWRYFATTKHVAGGVS